MLRDWLQRYRITFTRLKIEHPSLTHSPLLPRFRATLLLLWAAAILGLAYGRFIAPGQSSRGLSLTLTAVSWLVSLFIVLLQDPLSRLKLLLSQIITLLLVGIFFPVATVTYSLFMYSGTIVYSIKLVWVIGATFLGYFTVYLFLKTFILPFITQHRYPGIVTSPLLFGILILNYIAWYWPQIIAWFR